MPDIPRVAKGYHTGTVHQIISDLLQRIRVLEIHLASAGIAVGEDVLRAAGSPQGHVLLADLMRLALEEITGQKAAAAAEVAEMLETARKDIEERIAESHVKAGSVLADAGAESSRLTAAARGQADTVLAQARNEARQMLSRAAAHDAAVREGAQRRLDALVDLHNQTRQRLAQIHEVTGSVLDTDARRGDLQEEVNRVISASSSVTPPAPPAISGPAADTLVVHGQPG